MSVTIETLTAGRLTAKLERLAELRITIFRDFPYLYEGNFDYERRYLERFSRAADAVIIAAKNGEQIVGAATGAPIRQVDPEFAAPFLAHGRDIKNLFYCAESVLLPEYRGRGIGHAFFEYREEHARGLGATQSCFCAVIRNEDHFARPAGYKPLDPFWRKRGYTPLDGVEASFSWQDVSEDEETEKSLQFWLKDFA